MKTVYVAHPFGGLQENADHAEATLKRLYAEHPNVLYISPIHATGFIYDENDYVNGMDYCLELLSRCDELYLCHGWETSRGCLMERSFAMGREMPIEYE